MNNLKDSLIYKILSYLKVHELIINRRVCKRWLLLINEIKFEELNLINIDKEFDNYEFQTYKPIKLSIIIPSYNIPAIFKYEIIRNIFINLKKLKFNYLIGRDLEKLNYFIQLEHLEIDFCERIMSVKNLYLPELRIFKFNNWYLDGRAKKSDDFLNDNKAGCFSTFFTYLFANQDDEKPTQQPTQIKSSCKLIIDSFKLKYLGCRNLQKIRLTNPETVTYLEVAEFHTESLRQFKNLEILKFIELEIDTQICALDLSSSLKELHFHVCAIIIDEIHKLKRIFNQILNQKQILNEQIKNLEFYFDGIRMLDDQPFEYYGFDKRNDNKCIFAYKLINQNLTNLANTIPMYCYIQFSEFEQIFYPFKIELTNILNNIQCVIIDKINGDPNECILFLKRLPILSKLHIYYADFDLEFFDQLNNFCLKDFALECVDYDLHFDFILKFKLLKQFRTYQHVSIDVIAKALKNLHFLNYLRFYSFDTKIRIKKLNKNSYNLYINKLEPILSNINLDQLIDQIFYIIEEDNGKTEDDSSSCE